MSTADSRFQAAARHFFASVFLPDLRDALEQIAKKCVDTPEHALRAKSYLVGLHQGHRKLLDCEAARIEFDRYAVARLHAEFARIDARLPPA